jgi:DNA transposition AAA+ family ATPase
VSTPAAALSHLSNVAPATVPTKFYVQAQTNAKTALEQSKIAGFFGSPGTGKTTAIRDFCARCGVPSIYISAAVMPQRKEIYEEILLGSVGTFDPDATARELRRECEAVLAQSPWVVVVDECHNLRNMWHQQLRGLHDAAEFCLLLVGTGDAAENLKRDGQLWSRVKLRMFFETLEGAELLNSLRAMHPVLANTDPGLIEEIDRRDCRGNLRDWGAVLDLALALLPNAGTQDRLSQRVVRAVLFQRGR